MSFPRAVGQEPLFYNQMPTAARSSMLIPPTLATLRWSMCRAISTCRRRTLSFRAWSYLLDVRLPGVSLSTQSISSASLMSDPKSQPMIATATVTNTGRRRATGIVQCYVNVRGASTEQPVRDLKGFAHVTLDPGQS